MTDKAIGPVDGDKLMEWLKFDDHVKHLKPVLVGLIRSGEFSLYPQTPVEPSKLQEDTPSVDVEIGPYTGVGFVEIGRVSSRIRSGDILGVELKDLTPEIQALILKGLTTQRDYTPKEQL